jgi:potassium voltage-gated channel Eag-related subfamily H protein 8
MSNRSKVIISCYFALTTLSTVGYGDYFPISMMERIVAVVIMLGGVAFFSYIMGNFIEIISNYEKKMGVVDQSADLHTWLNLLTRFRNNNPLPK